MSWHDLTGQEFNDLVVIGRSKVKFPYSRSRVWDCRCKRCGRIKPFTTEALLRKRNKACGCAAKHDLIGKRFGNLTVIDRVPGLAGKDVIWKCLCDCTNICYRRTGNLLTQLKNPHSCGLCRRKYKTQDEVILGGRYKSILSRCYDPKNMYYKNYGGRGIYVCDEWRNDEFAFIKWSLEHGFRPDLSIDRIDNDGPYSPDNCRYVDKYVQDNNKRSNHYVTVGPERMSLVEWSRELGLDRTQMYSFAAKYTDERLVTLIENFRKLNANLMNFHGKVDSVRNTCLQCGMSDNDIANYIMSHTMNELMFHLSKGEA